MPLKIIFINIKEKHIMKIFKNKKVIVALVALVAAVAIAVSSALLTIAYLTSSAAVSNVFTIGNVGITMTESKVNPDGTKTDGGATQVDTNTYHLIPDKTYTKDPRITVKEGSVDSYLFVLVRNDIEAIEAQGESTIAHQLAANGWAKYTRASTGWVYIYVGFTEDGEGHTVTKVPAADVTATAPTLNFAQTEFPKVNKGDFILFESFSIASNANISAYGAAKVTLTAVAIQKEGFSTLADAWEAVVKTYPYIHTGTTP